MGIITALWRKDIEVMRRYSLYAAIMAVNCLIQPVIIVLAPMTAMLNGMFLIMFAAMPLQLEERGKGLALIASLPVKRSAVPAAQYLFLAILYGALVAVSGGLSLVLSSLPRVAALARGNLVPGVIVLSFPFIALSFLFPLWYRFGYVRMRILTSAFFLVMAIGSTMVSGIAGAGGRDATARAVSSALSGVPAVPVVSGCVLLTLACLGVSFLVSARNWERKEF